MNKNLVELVFILDASGSMQPLTTDTVGGVNGILAELSVEHFFTVDGTTRNIAHCEETKLIKSTSCCSSYHPEIR